MKKLSTISSFAVLALLTVSLSSCGVDPKSASRALEAQGMKEVNIEGYSFFGCGRDDEFASNFSATGANGVKITGTVCQGWFKGTTVRFD